MRITHSLPACLVAACLLGGCGSQGYEQTETASSSEAAPTTSESSTTPTVTPVSTEPVTLTYSVGGMHCGGCASTVKTLIAKVDGVRECEVSFENERATVTADGEAVGQAILAAFEEGGFELAPVDAEDEQTGS